MTLRQQPKLILAIIRTLMVMSILICGYFAFLFWGQNNANKGLFPSPLSPLEEKKFDLVRQIKALGINISSGPVWNEKTQGVELVTTKGIKIIFSSSLEIDDQIRALQLILKNSKIVSPDEKLPKVIDLRTVSPYVSF